MNFIQKYIFHTFLILGLMCLPSNASLDEDTPDRVTTILDLLHEETGAWVQNCPDERRALNPSSVQRYINNIGLLHSECLKNPFLEGLFQTHLHHWVEKRTDGRLVMLSGGRLDPEKENGAIGSMLRDLEALKTTNFTVDPPSFMDKLKEMFGFVSIIISCARLYPY